MTIFRKAYRWVPILGYIDEMIGEPFLSTHSNSFIWTLATTWHFLTLGAVPVWLVLKLLTAYGL